MTFPPDRPPDVRYRRIAPHASTHNAKPLRRLCALPSRSCRAMEACEGPWAQVCYGVFALSGSSTVFLRYVHSISLVYSQEQTSFGVMRRPSMSTFPAARSGSGLRSSVSRTASRLPSEYVLSYLPRIYHTNLDVQAPDVVWCFSGCVSSHF